TKAKDVKLAVRILDRRKRSVMGFNTQSVVDPMSLDFSKNRSLTVKFTVNNILGDGDFSLAVVTGPTVVTGIYHDNVVGVAGFTNYASEGHYPIIAPATMEIYDK